MAKPNRALRKLLAERIRQEAKRAELGTNALADAARVSRSQLYDVLATRKSPSIDWVGKVAHALEVETCELLMQPPEEMPF